jgi:hypothetical protein
MRLLTGMLSVEGSGVISSEQSMSGGRSDLVVADLQGRSLLVVEYKQRHSAAASAHQQQDTAQVRLDDGLALLLRLLLLAVVTHNCAFKNGHRLLSFEQC